jgi:hypothetical protein
LNLCRDQIKLNVAKHTHFFRYLFTEVGIFTLTILASAALTLQNVSSDFGHVSTFVDEDV